MYLERETLGARAQERGDVTRPDSNENDLKKRGTAESGGEGKTNEKRKHTENDSFTQ